MKRIELFTKEEIESYGFIYEPDATKCKSGRIHTMYSTTGKDKEGIVQQSKTIFECRPEKEVKDEIAFLIHYKHINSIYVLIPDELPCYDHVHNRVWFSGHTVKTENPLTKKWNSTGLLEGLQLYQYDEMSSILEKTAQWLIKDIPPNGSMTERDADSLAGIVLPAVRRVFEKIYPKKFPDVKWFYDDCKDFRVKNIGLLEALMDDSYERLNGEVEFCSYYCEDVIGRINKPSGGYMKYTIGDFKIDRDEYWFMTDDERQSLHNKYNSGSKAIPFDPQFAEKYGKKPEGPF